MFIFGKRLHPRIIIIIICGLDFDMRSAFICSEEYRKSTLILNSYAFQFNILMGHFKHLRSQYMISIENAFKFNKRMIRNNI